MSAETSVARAALLGARGNSGVILSQIVRGPEESANVGVLVDRGVRGQGIATTAIGLACRLAFDELVLHRLQAGIQPANVGSQKAFLRNGFDLVREVHVTHRAPPYRSEYERIFHP